MQLRIKTGYFTVNGLGALKASIDHLVHKDLPISIALGANEKATIQSDVDALYALMGCPRPNAKLCVINCTGGLFHPKVVHLKRVDGSQLAYVGSANVTPAGVNGANIEAGLLLDSRQGDPVKLLEEIAASVDHWFASVISGVTRITGPTTTQQLVADGTLGVVKQPAVGGTGGSSSGQSPAKRVPLAPLVSFPPLTTGSQAPSSSGAGPTATGQAAAATTQTSGGADVLVAEIGGGPRWKQANFPIDTMKNFFGVSPTANQFVQLYSVLPNGSQLPPANTQVVSVKSQNYRIELASVSGVPYPTNGRPIGVFRRIGTRQFRYRVFLPGDAGYAALDAALQSQYHGPSHHLRRIQITQSTLLAIWPTCPV